MWAVENLQGGPRRMALGSERIDNGADHRENIASCVVMRPTAPIFRM
jgi:hypothetical protein